jgi:hypothetical protein
MDLYGRNLGFLYRTNTSWQKEERKKERKKKKERKGEDEWWAGGTKLVLNLQTAKLKECCY